MSFDKRTSNGNFKWNTRQTPTSLCALHWIAQRLQLKTVFVISRPLKRKSVDRSVTLMMDSVSTHQQSANCNVHWQFPRPSGARITNQPPRQDTNLGQCSFILVVPTKPSQIWNLH